MQQIINTVIGNKSLIGKVVVITLGFYDSNLPPELIDFIKDKEHEYYFRQKAMYDIILSYRENWYI